MRVQWKADRKAGPHAFDPHPGMPTFCFVCGGRKEASEHEAEPKEGQ